MDVVTPSRFSKRRMSNEAKSKGKEIIIQNLLMKKHECHKRKIKYHFAYTVLYMVFATVILYTLSFQAIKCPTCEPCVQQNIQQSKTKPDYALKSTGGEIVSVLTANTYINPKQSYYNNWISNLYNRLTINHEEKASTILQPNTNPGNCWAFHGDHGAVIIKLFGHIYVTGLTVEHTSLDISPTMEISSAPRQFTLTGLDSKDDKQGFEFGSFEYNINGSPSQYFDVNQFSYSAFDHVKLNFTSNWGKREYTCVYRIQIHGDLYELIH